MIPAWSYYDIQLLRARIDALKGTHADVACSLAERIISVECGVRSAECEGGCYRNHIPPSALVLRIRGKGRER